MTATEWLNSEQKPISEGIELIKNNPAAKTFLVYQKCYTEAQKRSEIAKFLKASVPPSEAVPQSNSGSASAPQSKGVQFSEAAPQSKEVPPSESVPQSNNCSASAPQSNTPIPLRPNHYSEWRQYQSPELQAASDQLDSLYKTMAYYRQQLEKVIEQPNHSEADVSHFSKLVVAYDKKINSINARADAEWEMHVGKTVSDAVLEGINKEYRDADRTIQKEEQSSEPKTQSSKDVPPSEAVPQSNDPYETMTLAELQQTDLPAGTKKFYIDRRIELNRRMLRNLTPDANDERRKRAVLAASELLSIGKKLSDAVVENMKNAGINTDELLNG